MRLDQGRFAAIHGSRGVAGTGALALISIFRAKFQPIWSPTGVHFLETEFIFYSLGTATVPSYSVFSRRAHRLGGITSFFDEKGGSGSLDLGKREQGARLLDVAQKGAVVVVCSKLNRMFRSAGDALNSVKLLELRGISLPFIDVGGDVSQNGVAKLFFTIVRAVAEFERVRLGERQKDAKAQAIAEGRYTGGKKQFGYDVEIVNGRKKLVPNQDEQAIISFIKECGHLKLIPLQSDIDSRFNRSVSLATVS